MKKNSLDIVRCPICKEKFYIKGDDIIKVKICGDKNSGCSIIKGNVSGVDR